MRRASLLLLLLAACGDKDTTPPVDDSSEPTDADGDGYTADVDCADEVSSIHPDAVEICDGVDQDCDDQIDEDASDASVWVQDLDGDGFGVAGTEVEACAPPDGYVAATGDCDDTRAATRPGAPDTCNGVDDDCDGLIDEEDVLIWYRDADGDGWGGTRTQESCLQPEGYVEQGGDCDDRDNERSPGLREVCGDGIDNDCDDTDNGCSLSGDLSLSGAQAIWYGAGTEHYLGYSLALVGDVTGDGAVDLAIGSPYVPYSAASADYAGRVFVVSANGTGSSTADAVDVAQVIGLSNYGLGESVTGGHDFSGDGDVDLVVSATGATYNSDTVGAVYVFDSPMNGALIPSRAVATLYGDANSNYYGATVAALEDVTGDTWADLAVSDTSYYDASTQQYVGAVHLFHGPLRSTTDVSRARALFVGSGSYTSFGASVAYLGDQDGDGTGDLAISSPYLTFGGQSQRGGVMLFNGPLSGTYAVTDASAVAVGRNAGDYVGQALTTLGDANGDGYDDLAYTSTGYDGSGTDIGAVYLMFGPLSGTLGAADVDATVEGTQSYAAFGGSLAAGDLNNDGVPDLAVGCVSCTGDVAYSGVIQVVYGPFTGTMTAGGDFNLLGGSENSYLGFKTIIGDLNGDGQDDLAASAATADYSSYSYAGLAVSVLGRGL